jgi:hypothetical protein
MSEVKCAITILKEKLANADRHNLAYQRLSVAEMEAIWGTLEKSEKDYAKLEAQREALAAENAVMLKLLTDISGNHVEYFSEDEGYTFAGVPLDYVSEINMYVSRDVNAENPFPTTDAYLNSVRAEGVEIFAKHCDESIGFIEPEDETLYTLMEEQARNFAAQLRAGKDGE